MHVYLPFIAFIIYFVVRLTSGAGQLYPLNPNQSILYTWDCPVGKREINWQLDGAKDSSWKAIKFDKVHVHVHNSHVLYTVSDKNLKCS